MSIMSLPVSSVPTPPAYGPRPGPDLSELLRTQRFLAFALVGAPDLDAATTAQLQAYLSPDEQRSYAQLLREPKRTEFLLGRVLVRRILGAILDIAPPDIRLIVMEGGKPALPPFGAYAVPPSFNLSHSNGYLLCGVTQYGAIGIDVEWLGSYKEHIARRFFHPDEQRWLQELEPSQRAGGFYHLWTVKEACIKALGAGLRFPLRKLCITGAASGVSLGLCWQTLMIDPFVKAAVALHLPDVPSVPASGMLLHVDLVWLLADCQSGIGKETEPS